MTSLALFIIIWWVSFSIAFAAGWAVKGRCNP